MPFNSVPNKVDFIAQEHEVLKFWQENQSFEKMRQLRKGQPRWSFLDGPITANNPMGVHHGWGRTYKDLFCRYKTMLGHELRYQNGFDCQGLWVEVEVEKELGFKSKKDIENYGLAKFVLKCKERVLRYAAIQTEQSIRLGYWMEWNEPDQLRWLADKLVENPSQLIALEGPDGAVTNTAEQIVACLGLAELGGSYFTFSNENNFIIWTFLKKTWERNWLYRGADSMPWCPRCATAISQHEIVTDGYAEVTHPGVTLRFPLRGRVNESLLVWTTTPWTLTSNVVAAVGPDLTYVKVKQDDDILYLSKGTLHMLRGKHEVLGDLKGTDLEGWSYDGPFDDLPAAQKPGGVTHLVALIHDIKESAAQAHRIILWDDVSEAEGTGIVHIAPGCGAEDFHLGKQYGLPMVAPLDEEGYFIDQFGWLTGKNVSEISEPIFADLKRKGILYNVEDYTHRYPKCWRCGTDLVFRLVDEWFISMGEIYDKPREALTAEEKNRSLRYQIMDVVDQIRWIPDFGHAREMDWLRNMHDWMISKKRYWGLALPIWVFEDGSFYVVGSEKELKELAVEGWEEFEGHTPHRPWIDLVKIRHPKTGLVGRRIPDVGNPWLDAGIVSFSTMRYRNDPQYWRTWYPAHWISESFPGQFRNWFYSLLAMATVIDNSPPFLENFGYASLFAEDGRPMHKSWGNAIEFIEAADTMGVDVMRWLYCAHKPENNLLFGYHRADDVRRRFFIPLWNVYSFFATYAILDGWEPPQEGFAPGTPEGSTPKVENPLDRWILARLNQVVARVTEALDNSDPFGATLAVEPFVDDLSNWYVRRSRRRFWKSEQDTDKKAAYATLYHILVKLARTLSPFTPFATEVMYQNLVRAVSPQAHESVHHTDWPKADLGAIDEKLVEQMALARSIASLGLSARGNAGIKVRQPLAKALVHVSQGRAELSNDLVDIVADELNIKDFRFVAEAGTLVTYQVLPNNKLLGPKFGSRFPALRKALATLDPAFVAHQVAVGEKIDLALEDGTTTTLATEEILVQTQPAEGLAVAADKIVTIGIDSIVTPELRAEGLAREVVRHVQAMRKDAGFNIEDRITTYYQTSGEMAEVFQTWGDYIRTETLSTQLTASQPPSGAFVETHDIEGVSLTLGVKQNL
ncbi:MAG: class I tRNA ligase family protein [Anaerolineales bacterium]|nr:class I tRNA ligase family protein [Anaerolineales bacterium]